MALIVTMEKNYAVLEQPFTVKIVDCVVTDVEVTVELPIDLSYTFNGEQRVTLPMIQPTPDFCTIGFDFDGVYSSYPDTKWEFATIEDDQFVINTVDTSLHRTTETALVAFEPQGSVN